MMISAHTGLTWERWLHVLPLAERLGFHSIFRTDHYFTAEQQNSLEAYVSLAVAARETERIRFGPLVTPVTFRRPVDVGRMAAQIDLLSGGRFVMGLGAGWTEAEHVAYGVPFPPPRERFDRLAEAIQLMRALWTEGPTDFDGKFYQLKGADCLPKPETGRPPILIGGVGERRTLRLVAQYADEWNALNLTPEQFAAKSAVLEKHCDDIGRDPATIRRSMNIFSIFGPSQEVVDAVTRRFMTSFPPDRPMKPGEYRNTAEGRGWLVGSTDAVVDYLGRLAEMGLHEVQFPHMLLERDDFPEYVAAEIAPKLAAL